MPIIIIIVPKFSVTNKSVFGLFCSILLPREAQVDASLIRVLPEDGRQERWDNGDVKARGIASKAQ